MDKKDEFEIRKKVLEKAQAFYNGIMAGNENWNADEAIERSNELPRPKGRGI